MQIWVDADACPKAIKEVLFRAADRRQIETTLFANHAVRVPPSRFLRSVQVHKGFDVADNAILERLQPGDLVVTQDVPLADEVISRGATALNPRGTLYTRENIKDHLSRRDMMDELRSSGMVSGGPSALAKQDVQAFANALDRFLARNSS
ncbi:MAG: YaiI/YqxD family protein [Pseudomonadales bacterium]